MTCSPTCTSTDVLAGLSQISVQIQNLSTYLVIVSGLALFFLTATVILLWVNGRA